MNRWEFMEKSEKLPEIEDDSDPCGLCFVRQNKEYAKKFIYEEDSITKYDEKGIPIGKVTFDEYCSNSQKYIYGISVKKSHRKNGLATQLLMKAYKKGYSHHLEDKTIMPYALAVRHKVLVILAYRNGIHPEDFKDPEKGKIYKINLARYGLIKYSNNF